MTLTQNLQRGTVTSKKIKQRFGSCNEPIAENCRLIFALHIDLCFLRTMLCRRFLLQFIKNARFSSSNAAISMSYTRVGEPNDKQIPLVIGLFKSLCYD